jgi:hypothetical protein
VIASFFTRLFTWLTQTIDQRIGWHRLPVPLGLVILIGLRITLRQRNLYDTYVPGGAPRGDPNLSPSSEGGPRHLLARTADGTFNDLKVPTMGSANTRFGRNIPLDHAYPGTDAQILTPNPRTVSRELLTRETFQPATALNLLVAAWVQFMIHDWFDHGRRCELDNPWQVPLAPDDPWPQHPMRILRTHPDPTRLPGDSSLPPTYLNESTHWWDGSQIYGSDAATMTRMRSGVDGKLRIGEDGLLPVDPETGTDIAGFSGNWWVGLSLLHTLFTLEHNTICDRLRKEYPSWSDDDLFDKARLINVALMAKIHTVEWTPAILGHPTMQVAMNANWWGLAGEQIRKQFGRISSSEAISGIPGSETDHFGVPYSLTEEFVAVYRMHPLMPDEFRFRSLTNDSLLSERTLPEVTDRRAREVVEQIPLADLFYSFGTSHPGAITLHNYSRYLQRREQPDGTLIDLATTEIIRDRERGIPRYNEFRQLLHRPPVRNFEELTSNPVWVKQLKQIYDNDLNRVDTMVGLFAEQPPPGFGFSDTAFRIFILMASRRLNSDRFFTNDFTPQVYTPLGIEWINDNGMASILTRYFPGLAPSLHDVKNPFAPWPLAKS